MVEIDDSHLPPELPRSVLSRLDPKLAELYSHLRPAIASRISELVKAAQPQNIHPDRVLKFAYLYATAELSARGDPVAKEQTRRSKLELAGAIHGLGTGYQDDVEAKGIYRRGRRARQQIKASLESVLGRWTVFEQVVQKHRSELPLHVQAPFSDSMLQGVENVLKNMGRASVLDEEDLAIEHRLHGRTEIAQAYIWWHLLMAPYRGKWDDMHRLALSWRMTDTTSPKQFRNKVYRISKGAACTFSSASSWESVLSARSSY